MLQCIPIHPSHAWVDNSKIREYKRCPRRYWFKYIMGWTGELANKDAEFGSAWHKAMEVLWTKGTMIDNLEPAFAAFTKYLCHKLGRVQAEALTGAKSIDNVHLALKQYILTHEATDMRYTVLDIEPPAEVPITTVGVFQSIRLRLDLLLSDVHGKIWVMDHKTSGKKDFSWHTKWHTDAQFLTYIHALHCLFSPELIGGAVINGAIFRLPTKLKKDGTPYANGGQGNEFPREYIQHDIAALGDWQARTTAILERLEDDLARMDAWNETEYDKPWTCQWCKNDEGCQRYNRTCAYSDLCWSYPNIVQLAQQIADSGEEAPLGMKREWWDPAEVDKLEEEEKC